MSGLEGLGSLPLAGLQGLQGLQSLPPELALKLLSPELLMNGLAPLVSPPVIVKQGEAKCNECNIVFYKEESLQVHKKHYCAARDKSADEGKGSAGNVSPNVSTSDTTGSSSTTNTSTTTTSPTARLPASGSSESSASTSSGMKDDKVGTKPLLQFICTLCGIKFTSPDNLAAHQTYYCTKRELSGLGSEETKGLWRCPRCRCTMPETLQAAHQCVTPAASPSQGWKCPCCPIVSPTAAAAQKHLETHAGIKAFRCTICGYRGNTLRGMRTHIRMHFEKRTNDLQEESFIACILEEDDHTRVNRVAVAQHSAEATAAVRMAAAAAVAAAAAPQQEPPRDPRVILENPTLSALLAEGSERSEQPLKCHFCPFVTPYRSNLMRHLTLLHKVGLESKFTQDLKQLIDNHLLSPKVTKAAEASVEGQQHDRREPVENGNPVSPPPVPAVKLEPEVKLEVEDLGANSEEEPHPDSSTCLDKERPPVPMLSPKDSAASPNASSVVSSRGSGTSGCNGNSSTSASNNTNSNGGPRYCKDCNISFNLLDSFIAHKRFYCTKPEASTPPETAVQ